MNRQEIIKLIDQILKKNDRYPYRYEKFNTDQLYCIWYRLKNHPQEHRTLYKARQDWKKKITQE